MGLTAGLSAVLPLPLPLPLTLALPSRIGDVPVDPDAPDARELLITELAKPEYQAAKPTLFDIIAKAFWDWLNSLTIGTGPGGAPLGLLLLLVIVLVVVGIAFLVFGLPRLNRRSAVAGELFGENDERDAGAIRRDARRAADAGDWATAIAEQFRAIARSLGERTVVTVSPGTTAHDFASRAGVSFPDAGADLRSAAEAFDSVRYLGGLGSRADWESIVDLDGRLERARPASLAPIGAPS